MVCVGGGGLPFQPGGQSVLPGCPVWVEWPQFYRAANRWGCRCRRGRGPVHLQWAAMTLRLAPPTAGHGEHLSLSSHVWPVPPALLGVGLKSS